MTNEVVLTWDLDASEHEVESPSPSEIARTVSELDGNLWWRR